MIVSIVGAGGHGHDIAEIAEALGRSVVFYDRDHRRSTDGYGMGSLHRWFAEHCGEDYAIGVNDPATRRNMAVGRRAATLVHPWATAADDAVFSPGVVVGAGTTVGPQVTLGPHVHLGAGCTITRTTVGAFTTISPGVDIAGDVTIGEECLIGVGSTVSNLVTIGDRCVIGAGAVVISDVPDDTTVAGVPAKPLQRKGEAA